MTATPASWVGDYKNGMHAYLPVGFSFGLQATPVKPFPRQPYIHNALHLDCGIKVKGNYVDVLAGRYDELKAKGVTTLILHEKWNKSQNWFELSEFTTYQIKTNLRRVPQAWYTRADLFWLRAVDNVSRMVGAARLGHA